MIQTWDEIVARYEKIKNHKPRASRKLNELGEIISSAYRFSPEKADTMWQYIIDLNIADNVEFARFYVAQVFKKMVVLLPLESATSLLLMRNERLRLLLLHGYEGSGYLDSAQHILGYFIKIGDINGCHNTIALISEFLSCANDIGNSQRITHFVDRVISSFERATPSLSNMSSKYYITPTYRNIPANNLIKFYEYCETVYPDTLLAKVAFILHAIVENRSIENMVLAEDLLRTMLNNNFNTIFLCFLYLEQDVFEEQVDDFLWDYLRYSGMYLPLNYNNGSFDMVNWYRSLVFESESLLEYEFTGHDGHLSEFMIDYLNFAIESGNWDGFTKYYALAIMGADDYGFSECKDYLFACINYYILGNKNKPSAHITFRGVTGFIPAIDIYGNPIEFKESINTIIARCKLSLMDLKEFVKMHSTIYKQIEDTDRKKDFSEIIFEIPEGLLEIINAK